jgi:hypothetical protein
LRTPYCWLTGNLAIVDAALVPRSLAAFNFGDLGSNLAELAHDHPNISEVGGIARALEISDPLRKQPEEHDSALQQLDGAFQFDNIAGAIRDVVIHRLASDALTDVPQQEAKLALAIFSDVN